ncbi:prepilin-type N-terminal cleavage/methylation domain-containing protein [Thermocrinis sp.]|uniref:type IV pilus modification PilV family protein n=1 Tax=Thermocrinis sp. TaxID=2024383 RepID=UPI002FDEF385
MFGTCKGFTLVEVLVALTVLAIGFGVLFELLANAQREYQLSKKLYEDVIFLSNSVIQNKFDSIEVKEKNLKDYPNIKEVELKYRSAVIYIYKR